MTAEEYLAWEEAQVERHEFVDGTIRAMSGGSWSHNRVIASLTRFTGNRLDGSSCQNFTNSQRVYSPEKDSYLYPDVGVACGVPLFGKGESLLNPAVIFEALSPSTQKYDRFEKFRLYQAIKSLKEYFLVHQDVAQADAFRRQANGEWDVSTYTVYAGLGATLIIESLGIALPLSEIYSGVETLELDASPEEQA